MKITAFLLTAFASVLIAACGKDKFETTPKIEITGYNTKHLVIGQILNVTMDYFDKEGDLNNAGLTAMVNRLNAETPNIPLTDTFYYILPDFPPKDKGEIVARIPYNSLKRMSFENDTIQLKLAVVDREGNASDTVTTDNIIILLP